MMYLEVSFPTTNKKRNENRVISSRNVDLLIYSGLYGSPGGTFEKNQVKHFLSRIEIVFSPTSEQMKKKKCSVVFIVFLKTFEFKKRSFRTVIILSS